MDHKSWIWKRKASVRTYGTNKKSGGLKEKALELERSLEDLNGKLSSVQTESNAKDDLLAKQAKVAEEAIAGWEKAEAEALSLKQQLDDALLHKEAAEERLVNIDIALNECMQQLRVVKEDQQIIIGNAAIKISREQEKVCMLEESLVETNKRLTNLDIENNKLSKILEAKEQLIKDLSESKSKLEVNFTEVKARTDSLEKNNASLRYEVCILQKELEIRNEERDFNLRSADAAHRQQLESVKKIAKLETECQRLRVMVRKRLPGPAAIAKMRSEVEILGNNGTETRKKRLRAIEEENKILRESLIKKNSELQSSRVMFARTASKLSLVEAQFDELSKGQASYELARISPMSHDLPLASISEYGGNEDNVSCAGSWASALISELEHFKSGKLTAPLSRSAGVSELSLMDDFVEMEKLAIVSIDATNESSLVSSAENKVCIITKEASSEYDLSEAAGKELVPIESLSDFNEANHDNHVSYRAFENYPSWLQDILRVIIQKHHMTQRSIDAILEEVRVALNKKDSSTEARQLYGVHYSGKVLQSRHSASDSFDGAITTDMLNSKSSTQPFQINLETHVLKLIELVEGIIHRNIHSKNLQHLISEDLGGKSFHHKSATLTGYLACAFLWECSELNALLRHFVTVCNDLLNKKADLVRFTAEVTSALDWIINHCFSLQDVSDMKETIKKHLDSDEILSKNELKAVIYPDLEVELSGACEETNVAKVQSMPLISTSNGLYFLSRMEDIESKLKDENEQLKYEILNLESRKKNMEERVKEASAKNETLITQLQISEESISNLQVELAKLKESKGLIEDQIENQKLINENVGTQLTVAQAELDEAHKKLSSLEVELEEKSNCCEELEAACLELQLQLESASSMETSKHIVVPEDKHLRTEHEIAVASEKLAACQETILNLGKQFKALASPTDAPLFDKVISIPATTKSKHWPQLIDQLRTEDETIFADPKSPKTKEIICTERPSQPAAASDNPNSGLFYGQTIHKSQYPMSSVNSIIQQPPVKAPLRHVCENDSSKYKAGADGGMLMVVPKRQKGGVTLLRKLLMRRKNDSNNKLTLPVGS